jgi:hypothetical protein
MNAKDIRAEAEKRLAEIEAEAAELRCMLGKLREPPYMPEPYPAPAPVVPVIIPYVVPQIAPYPVTWTTGGIQIPTGGCAVTCACGPGVKHDLAEFFIVSDLTLDQFNGIGSA